MKIGIFDSGLGGLNIARSVRAQLPQYDYIYLGDTMRVPYGNRSQETILAYTRAAMEHLFAQDCQIIIIACNTASAAALRILQQTYLPNAYPDRRILGVVVPMLEQASESGCHNIGLIGTDYIVHSNVYAQELAKINPAIRMTAQATPLLVPLLEMNGEAWLDSVLRSYLSPLLAQDIEALVLGCTHYGLLKPYLAEILPANVAVFSQDDTIPVKLADYLERHPEQETCLSRGGNMRFCVTDAAQSYNEAARKFFNAHVQFERVTL